MKTKEQKIAKLLELVEDVLAKDGRFATVEKKVKALCELLNLDEKNDGIDIRGVVEEVDRIKAVQQALADRVRTHRSPYYVPGLEDVGKRFSVTRALLAHKARDWSKAGFEKECLDAVFEKAGSIIASDDEQGGIFIPEQIIPDWIPALYIQSEFVALDGEGQTRITMIGGLTGSPAKIPEFKGGLQAYWVGEADAHTKSRVTSGLRQMTPKKLGVLFSMTQEMIENAQAFDPFIRREVTRQLAQEWDRVILYGTGGDHQPRGIVATDGVKIYRAENGSVYSTLAAARDSGLDWAGGVLAPEKLEEMKVIMREAKVRPDASFHTVMSPRFELKLKSTRIEYHSGQENEKGYVFTPFLSEEALRSLIGPYFATEHIASNKLPGASVSANTTSTTTKFSDVVRGNLSEIVGGMWGGIRFINDGGTGADLATEETNFLARIRVDSQIRRREAIVLCPDARATE